MRLVREDYLRKIRPFFDTDLIKVITGVRRGGKSVLLETMCLPEYLGMNVKKAAHLPLMFRKEI